MSLSLLVTALLGLLDPPQLVAGCPAKHITSVDDQGRTTWSTSRGRLALRGHGDHFDLERGTADHASRVATFGIDARRFDVSVAWLVTDEGRAQLFLDTFPKDKDAYERQDRRRLVLELDVSSESVETVRTWSGAPGMALPNWVDARCRE